MEWGLVWGLGGGSRLVRVDLGTGVAMAVVMLGILGQDRGGVVVDQDVVGAIGADGAPENEKLTFILPRILALYRSCPRRFG